MEWELGALAHRTGKHEQRDNRQGDREDCARRGQFFDRLADLEGAGVHEDGHDPEREADVPDAVHDERLLGGQGCRTPAIPEPDQQVARQADQFPGDEDHQEAAGEDQDQHREHEQVEVGEETPVPRVVGHVPDRVDVNEHANRGHDDQQDGRQVVDGETDVDVERLPGRDPLPELDREARVTEAPAQRGHDHDHADQPADDHDTDGQPVGLFVQPPSEEPRQDESCQGQRRDQDDERLHAVGLLLAHRVVLVDQRCSAVAEDRDDDGQADRCLGRRDRDDQEGDDGRIRPEPIDERAEGDDREVDAVEHELDRHEHADRIAPGQEAEGADCEQQPGQDQVGIE